MRCSRFTTTDVVLDVETASTLEIIEHGVGVQKESASSLTRSHKIVAQSEQVAQKGHLIAELSVHI